MNMQGSLLNANPAGQRPLARWFFGLCCVFLALALVLGSNCGPSTPPDETKTETPHTEQDAADAPVEPTNSPDASDSADEPTLPDTPDAPDLADNPAPPDAADEPGPPEPPDVTDTADDITDSPAPVAPRLLALGKAGQIAALELASPWSIKASGDLKKPSVSARCFGGRCLVVHPSPADALSLLDPQDLSKVTTIQLDPGADPRDVAFLDRKRAVVSQYGKSSLLLIDLDTKATQSVDLSALADKDGNPEALRMARCGERVFVQLLRVDHKTDVPDAMGAAIGVVDFPAGGSPQVVDADASAAGVQAIKLEGRPNFDMPVDCASGSLYLAAPKPLMQGGGWYEEVNLKTLKASRSSIETGAQVGGFAVVSSGLYWLITHTATGPAGNSTHLNLVGGPQVGTYNSFADDKVEELALDAQQDLLFFPDNCVKSQQNSQCESGVHVFHARTGAAQPNGVIALGFPPMELAISR